MLCGRLRDELSLECTWCGYAYLEPSGTCLSRSEMLKHPFRPKRGSFGTEKYDSKNITTNTRGNQSPYPTMKGIPLWPVGKGYPGCVPKVC